MPRLLAVGPRAGDVAAVRLGCRPADRRAGHEPVLRVVGLVPVRVVIPSWDRTLGTLVACLDATLRTIGGAPTYLLTDNEKTVQAHPALMTLITTRRCGTGCDGARR